MRTSRREEVSSARSDTSCEEPDMYESLGKYYDTWYEDITEDLDFNPFTRNSDIMVFVAKRSS